ncbi:MAG: phosphoadenosine phosphosulfate reductase family protein [Anaerolineaceae bacterium]|nr:phosphoadenosine phosphosulfate reductase family protein [Anaerolineaceae bacterium]
MNDNERSLYLLYAKLRQHQWRIERSLKIIERGLQVMKSPYISMSFGKDSLVMSHLIWSHHPKIPMMYVNCGTFDEWPDTQRVKQAFLSLFNDPVFVELSAPSIWQFFESVGFFVQDEEVTKETRRAQSEYARSLGEALDDEAKRRGCDGAFIGLRAEESRIRNMLFNMRGDLYFAKTRGQWACHPLAEWTSKDIWAYIAKNDLPYNELYDLAPEGRELARNGAMFGTRSARYGRLVFLKRTYPDLFNRFVERFPEAGTYV